MPLRDVLERQLTLSARRLETALQDVTEEEARQRPHGLAPIAWQIGHLAIYDGRAAREAGFHLPVPEGYEALFLRGTDGSGDFPPLREIVAQWRAVHARLLEVLKEADLEQPLDGAERWQTLGEGLVYAHFHRNYHLGKIMTLRALLGKPRLS